MSGRGNHRIKRGGSLPGLLKNRGEVVSAWVREQRGTEGSGGHTGPYTRRERQSKEAVLRGEKSTNSGCKEKLREKYRIPS